MTGREDRKPSAEYIAAVLSQLASANPVGLQETHAELADLLNSPSAIGPLTHVLCTHAAPQVRQMAAVLLRSTLQAHYDGLMDSQREELKGRFIAQLTVESHSASQRALVSLCTKICDLESDMWPALADTGENMVKCEPSSVRVAGFVIFQSLFETVPSQAISSVPFVASLLGKGLMDKVYDVRVAALHAINSACFAAAASDGVVMLTLARLVPTVVGVAVDCRHRKGDDYVRTITAVFEILTVVSDTVVDTSGKECLRIGLEFAHEVFGSDENSSARVVSSEFLIYVAINMPKTILNLGVVAKVVRTACHVGMHDPHCVCSDDDGDDEDDSNPRITALRLLQALSTRPELSEVVFAEVITTTSEGANTTAAASNSMVGNALRIIGEISEGCSYSITKHADEVITRVASGCSSLRPLVVGRALETLGFVCEALDVDEMSDHVIASVADMSLSAVLTGMRHAETFVKRHACMALKPVLLVCEGSSTPHAQIQEVSAALQSITADVAIEAMTAIGALVDYDSEAFAEPLGRLRVIDGIVRLTTPSADTDTALKAAALETAAELIPIWDDCKILESIAPHAAHCTTCGDEARQAAFSFFAKTADSTGPSVVVKFGAIILKEAVSSLERQDVGPVPTVGGVSHPDNDPHVFDTSYKIPVRTGYLDEKVHATACIGSFATAAATKAYVEACASSGESAIVRGLFNECLKLVDSVMMYLHEDLRVAAYRTMCRLAAANAWFFIHHPLAAFAGPDLPRHTMLQVLRGIREDEDPWVVTNLLRSAAIFFAELPSDLVVTHRDEISQSIEILLRGNALCQLQSDEAEGEFDDSVSSDESDGLTEAIGDVIEALSRVLRGYFAREFHYVLEMLVDSLHHATSKGRKQSMMFGSVAGVLMFMNWDRCTSVKPPLPSSASWQLPLQTADDISTALVPCAVAAAQSTESLTLQRNAVFLLGVMYMRARETALVWESLPVVLRTFEGVLAAEKSGNGAVVDNVVGAVSRIITSTSAPAGATFNKETMLRVILGHIPLRCDPTENITAARALLFAAEAQLDALFEPDVIQQVLSCLVTAVLLHWQRGGKHSSPWAGAHDDPNDEMVCFDAAELAAAIACLNRIRERSGEGPFRNLSLKRIDALALTEIMQTRS